MHAAQAIYDAFVTKVTGLTKTGTNVHKSNPYAIIALPAINVLLAQDQVQEHLSSGKTTSKINVVTEVRVKVTGDQIVADLLTIREQIHIAIMADTTLGLSHVIDCLPTGATPPEITGDHETPAATMQIGWEVTYRTSTNNPGV